MGAVLSAVIDASQSVWVGKVVPQNGDVNYATQGRLRHISQDELAGIPLTSGLAGLGLGRTKKRVVCIADTHTQHRMLRLPPGDILILAGDIFLMTRFHFASTHKKRVEELRDWLQQQPYSTIIVVGGNHDKALEYLGAEAVQHIFDSGRRAGGAGPCIRYLCHSGCVAEGLRVYGSPASLGRSGNAAFQPRGKGKRGACEKAFSDLPAGMDIMVTHQCLPCSALDEALTAARPRLHVGGHLHRQYGVVEDPCFTSVTASIVNCKYKPTNLPIVVDL